jgi:tRNA uridine 5-carbamoylmethylation protein Kti12
MLELENLQNPETKKPLVVIYGPPGVGKLTVAKELNKLTSLPLFHGHLSRDLVKSVFTEINALGFIDKIRLAFFDFAAKNNCGLIFTFVYAYKFDDEFMEQISDIAKNNNTPIYFIQLLCDEKAWQNRVVQVDRKQHKKVVDFDAIRQTMQKYDLLTPYCTESINHKSINITNLEPIQTAQIIQTFLSL